MFSDIKYAVRSLSRAPGFVAVALATLCIGIGANTAIFSIVNDAVLKPLPYPEPDRVVSVVEKTPKLDRNQVSTLNYLDWVNENTVFQSMGVVTGGSAVLTGVDQAVRLQGSRVSTDYFNVYGVKAALGRTFVAGEDQPGNDRVVVISHSLWQSQFGSDPSILGRTMKLDDQSYTVIGVLPENSYSERGGWLKIWRPLTFTAETRTRNFRWLSAVARLKPGVTLEQARANMDAIAARIARDYPKSNKDWGVSVVLFSNLVRDGYKTVFHVLLAAVGMVLMIGCANLANLMLARGMTRQREVAIRSALGAGSGRLIRQFLTESLLLSLTGGALGLVLGYAILAVMKVHLSPSFVAEVGFELDGRVLLFTLSVSVATGVLCGLVPALQARRPDLTSALKQGGGAGSGRSQYRARTTLVVAEVALAFALLVGAGLLLRTFAQMQKVDVGFDATNIVTTGFHIPRNRFKEPAAMNEYLRQVRETVAALPGVRDAAFASSPPMLHFGNGTPFQRADKPIENLANRDAAIYKTVSSSYFHTLGLKLMAGRTLTEQDTQSARPVIVINETMRKKHFADADPIGKRLLIQKTAFDGGDPEAEIAWEVVGVVADEKVNWIGDKEDRNVVYVTTEQSPQLQQALLVRTESDPGLLYQPLRAAIKKVNSDQVLSDLKTLEQIKSESLFESRMMIAFLGTFAGIALLLAAVGIYGVISYSVAQRTREIGIRSALGADAGSILRLVLYGGMKTVLVGLILGAAGVFALSGLMASLLFGISERDPFTLSCVAALLAITALVACYLPARRAAKVDPLAALRAE